MKAEQLRLRLAGGAPLLRVRAGEAGRARRHREDVRHRRTGGSRTRRSGTRTSRPTTCSTAATLLGRFYLDMHPRDGQVQARRAVHAPHGQDGVQLPEGVLVCNFPAAAGAQPALMQHSDVETFFHEFGHLLHHIFGGHQRWAAHLGHRAPSGTSSRPRRRCSRSGPGTRRCSQTLREALPDRRADPGGAGRSGCGAPTSSARGSTSASRCSTRRLSLQHLQPRPEGARPGRDGPSSCRRSTRPFPYVDGHATSSSRFGHLDGYSAIYYTYMWSLVIAKDLFTVFKQRGDAQPRAGEALPERGARHGRLGRRGGAGEGLPRARLRLRRLRGLAATRGSAAGRELTGAATLSASGERTSTRPSARPAKRTEATSVHAPGVTPSSANASGCSSPGPRMLLAPWTSQSA